MNLSETYRKYLNESLIKEGYSDNEYSLMDLANSVAGWVNSLKMPTKSEINKTLKEINSWNDTNVTLPMLVKQIDVEWIIGGAPGKQSISINRSDVPKAVKILNSLGYKISEKKFEKLQEEYNGFNDDFEEE